MMNYRKAFHKVSTSMLAFILGQESSGMR